MSGRGGDSRSYRDRSRSRSRSRARAYRDDYRKRSRERPGRGDIDTRERRDEGRHGRSRSRSRSPRRRSQSRSRYRSRSRQRRRSRSHSSERDRGKRVDRSRERRRRSRSRSRSVSSTDSSSSDHRHHRKKDKRHKRKRSKSRDKERKKEKKDKKKKKNVGAVSNQWGKYGIITETDMFTKETEFRTWLVEERKINPETISKDQTRKEFAKFVEDFNTATLPHEKFYDMTKYEARMAALRSGEFVPPADDSYDPNADMLVLQSHQRDKRKAKDSSDTYLSKDQLMELRKVQAERIEVGKMKLLGMDIKQNMGVRMDGSTFDE